MSTCSLPTMKPSPHPPPMASRFDDAGGLRADSPNQDLIMGPIRCWRSTTSSHRPVGARSDEQLAARPGRMYGRAGQCMSGCTDCLKTHVLHKAVYMLIDDLVGVTESVEKGWK
jgi:hypothetical protein